MTQRNLSPYQMFRQLAEKHKPECSFNGKTKDDFNKWKKVALPKVLATLGDFPKRVPLNPELLIEWEHDGLIKQRWAIDTQEYLSVIVQVNFLPKLRKGGRHPALCCWHGHSQFGKESVMGNDSSDQRQADIRNRNYNYGHQMAQSGFVTFGIDWIGKGELDDAARPSYLNLAGDRDWCNLYYLNATMLGMSAIGINVTLGRAATDFVCTLPWVDADRLGVMGLSGGGTMTLWSTLCDRRFKASEIICYSSIWPRMGFRDLDYCGMQVAPGLFKLVDIPDAQGLIAPQPLLIDIGIHDTCFPVDDAMICYHKVETIYKAAGAAQKLELDLFPGEHAWGGHRSKDFFKKHLG
ncbi:MAG: alpha/beta hydrolase family protein [Planctomycetota bacterium]